MSEEEKAALIDWIQEVNALLCYQPDIPMAHKEDLVRAADKFLEAVRNEGK